MCWYNGVAELFICMPWHMQLTLRGFRLMSKWTASVVEQSAWKFQNPVEEKVYLESGGKNRVSFVCCSVCVGIRILSD